MPSCRFKHTCVVLATVIFLAAVPALAIDWPLYPENQPHPLGNSYGEYQNYGSGPYFHPGIDILDVPGGPVFAIQSGYVKAVLTTGGELYWRVAIGDSPGAEPCDGWLYAHLEEFSIAVLEGEYVNEGQYLGDLVSWPVANFHHLHFSKISNSGQPWASNWDFIGNPLEEIEVRPELDPPVFSMVNGGVPFAFCPNNTHTYFATGATLSGPVDIIARVADKVGHPTWELTPYMVTYEVYDDTFSTGPIVGNIATGFLFWNSNYGVTFQDDATYDTRGDYDARDYYYIVTNTDGDSIVEPTDIDGAWHTEQFANGPWWVKVSAYDLGGNVTSESMQVTTENFFELPVTVAPCDGDPDSSGTTITAPGILGQPHWVTNSDGACAIPGMALGSVYLEIRRDYYEPIDTTLFISDITASSLDIELQPAYVVGDLDGDSFPTALDLGQLIDLLFAGSTDYPDAHWAGDLDFDRFYTALDLGILIDVLFAGAEPPGTGRCYP